MNTLWVKIRSFFGFLFSQKSMRRTHLYLGCFFTPMLLFYILTGWLQVVDTDRLKSPMDAETVIQKIRTVHVDQVYPGENEFAKPSSPKLFKVLTITMCIAATVTIVLGVFLAFKTLRNQWPVWVSIVLGILLPLLMLWLGQGR